MHPLSDRLLLGYAPALPGLVAGVFEHPLTAAVALVLLFSCTWLGLVLGARAWRRKLLPARQAEREYVAVHHAARAFFRHCHLTRAAQFLDMPGVIVSGHPGRHVACLTLDEEGGPVAEAEGGTSGQLGCRVYLKREERVSWRVRVLNLLSGFGPVSLSCREAQVLQALERERLPGPRWLAAGEDGRGRAFLMIEAIPDVIPVANYLRLEMSGERRRMVARRLGAVLAHLHEAGFEHRDLYAKHVLVHPDTGEVYLLDWQRARRRPRLDGPTRARELAALHATLAEVLATPRERLLFVRAYLEGAASGGVLSRQRPCRRWFLARVEREARQLLTRRHVREKRQLPLTQAQTWVPLAAGPEEEGEVCVSAALEGYSSGSVRHWLGLDHPPTSPTAKGPHVTRRWLTLPGTRRTLLVRRQSHPGLALLWSWFTGRPVVSPEQRQAALLLRLERHAVTVPRVLALGRRQADAGTIESFLLTEPVPDTVRLTQWLGARPEEEADGVLRQAGSLLARLHDAACYLAGDALAVLAVRQGEDEPAAVVMDSVEGVTPLRAQNPRLARRDLVRMRELLAEAGCSQNALRRFLTGYHQTRSGPAGAAMTPVTAGSLLAPPASASTPQPPTPTDSVNRESFWKRLLGGCRRLRHRADWPQFVGTNWDDHIMNVPVTDRFHSKQGRSTGRWVLTVPGEQAGEPSHKLTVYLKRHYQLPWWQGVLATVWPRGNWSPAFQEWDHLEWARRQGVPVPAVVAAGEFTGPWGRLQSFLAVEELTDMLPLNEAIPQAAARMEPAAFRRWKKGLIAEMARLTRLLHDRQCFHKDLYLCHFYIHRDHIGHTPEAGWQGNVWVIDLHRLAHHPWTWRVWQLKDLAQLLYSSEIPGVDTRDQVLFWRCYRGVGPRRGRDRFLRTCVLFKWRRYRQHNLRRKARLRSEMAHGSAREMSKT